MVALARTLVGWALTPVVSAVIWLMNVLHQSRGANRVTRRTFLRNTLLGSVGVVALQAVGGFVYFFWPNKTGAFGKEITVPMSAVPAVGAAPYVNQDGKFYIINNEDGALAVYWKCTHLGCTVPWNEGQDLWVCPCHGSVYNRFAERIAGPAPRPLDLMPLRVEGNNVIVDTNPDSLVIRSSYDPSQAEQL